MTNTGRPVVFIADCNPEDVREGVFRAIQGCGFTPGPEVRTVAIKLNLCYYWDASTGETTDRRVVSAIIDYVREKVSPDARILLVEADATAMKTAYSFPILGYDTFAREKGVELFNLSQDSFQEFPIEGKGGAKITLPVPLTMLTSDLVINVPKLKVPRRVPLTCAMKNLFGAIRNPVKAGYHPHLHEVIAGMNGIVRPHLTVVDGLVALGKHPYAMNIIIAGTNTVSVDAVAARIAGYRPRSIGYIRIAEDRGFGDTDARVEGAEVGVLARRFPRINITWHNLLWSLQLAAIRIYTRITGDSVPPVLGDL